MCESAAVPARGCTPSTTIGFRHHRVESPAQLQTRHRLQQTGASRPIRPPLAGSGRLPPRRSTRWGQRGGCSCQIATAHFHERERRLVSQSLEGAAAKPMESEAYRAKRDCWSPVPLITTSHCVSERDSMVRYKMDGGREKRREQKKKKRKNYLKAFR